MEAYISSLKRYISLSFRNFTIFPISSSSNVVPDGLLGFVRIISFVLDVIYFSSISFVNLKLFPFKSMYFCIPPDNFINEPYPTYAGVGINISSPAAITVFIIEASPSVEPTVTRTLSEVKFPPKFLL